MILLSLLPVLPLGVTYDCRCYCLLRYLCILSFTRSMIPRGSQMAPYLGEAAKIAVGGEIYQGNRVYDSF